jgi:hypothetical protein
VCSSRFYSQINPAVAPVAICGSFGANSEGAKVHRLYFASAALVVASVASVPAMAGEEVLYKPAPEWVKPASIDNLLNGNEEVVLFDRQRLLDHGTLHIY